MVTLELAYTAALDALTIISNAQDEVHSEIQYRETQLLFTANINPRCKAYRELDRLDSALITLENVYTHVRNGNGR